MDRRILLSLVLQPQNGIDMRSFKLHTHIYRGLSGTNSAGPVVHRQASPVERAFEFGIAKFTNRYISIGSSAP